VPWWWKTSDGPVTLVLHDGTEVVGDELLVAAGRRPRTDDIGLETVGLSPGGYLKVDDRLRVLGVEGGGCTPPVTSTAARCLPTRASTRPGSRVTSSPAATSRRGPITERCPRDVAESSTAGSGSQPLAAVNTD
jgi:hypothetical protein